MDAWLLAQWEAAMRQGVERPEVREAPVQTDMGPVYPQAKLLAVADHIMMDSKGRVSRKRAMETLELIAEYQRAARER